MPGRRVALVAGATVSFGVAVALKVVVVVVVMMMSLWREYGPLWTDPAIYLILIVPAGLPALLGTWLLLRSRRE